MRFLIEAAQDVAVAVEVELVAGWIASGHNIGEVGQPARKEAFQVGVGLYFDCAVRRKRGDFGDDLFGVGMGDFGTAVMHGFGCFTVNRAFEAVSFDQQSIVGLFQHLVVEMTGSDNAVHVANLQRGQW